MNDNLRTSGARVRDHVFFGFADRRKRSSLAWVTGDRPVWLDLLMYLLVATAPALAVWAAVRELEKQAVS